MGKITQSSTAPEAPNAKAFQINTNLTARERKHHISRHVKVNMKVNDEEKSSDVLAKITPGMSKLNGYAPAPNPFKMIDD